ncbi:MBL fold metallo-hydrolase [Niallia oryzisoli]|uniref:MBL fold metallo-hydrolase n=1 Tax=Niallia oryzisoli TaxID=1737571 RepID=UPI003736A198
MIYFILLVLAGCDALFMFLYMHPAFGGNPSKAEKEAYQGLANFRNGKFINPTATKISMSPSDFFSMIKESLSRAKETNPADPIPVSKIDWSFINSKEDSFTWFGHSAFLLSMDNKKILIDPMLGPVASPVSFVGSKRYSHDLLPLIDSMPPIDAVFLTHDHYDHLDYPSIRRLKNKVEHFFVPNGVGVHLIRWGVPKEKISELNWWDETKYKGLTVALTPSQHFSGRGPFNRDTTLWGGWVILGQQTRLYTSGDGGYGDHFKEIGKKYGPFDLTLIEGGQYDRRWESVHMIPEQAVQANQDVLGKTMMLMHWGAFTLAYHSWTDPIERAIQAAEKEGVQLIAPKIGDTVRLNGELPMPHIPWWKERK